MTFVEQQLKAWLEEQQPLMPLGLEYSGPTDFVLQHGEWFEPRPYPEYMPRGAQLKCFGNAIVLAVLFGLRYVEGYALSPAGRVIHHGWNSEAGQLVDSTWLNTGVAYIGVEFSVGRADDATWNGDATILDDPMRGWPVLAHRWEGEDFDRYWPDSDGMKAIRGRIEQLGGVEQAQQFARAIRVPIID